MIGWFDWFVLVWFDFKCFFFVLYSSIDRLGFFWFVVVCLVRWRSGSLRVGSVALDLFFFTMWRFGPLVMLGWFGLFRFDWFVSGVV